MLELEWQGASDTIRIAEREGIGVVRIDRPEKLNALTPAMLPELAEAIGSVASTNRGLVLTGTGRAFSAGDDLDATADLDEAGFRDLIAGFQNLTRAVLDTTVPVVAALNGLAVGGAAELALACDARVGAHSTYFLFPENRIGLTISNGASLLLPRLLGPRAIPLILDGVRIGAEDAVALGLLTSVVGDPVAEAIALLDRWTAPGTATAFHLRLLRPDRNEIEAAMARETAVAGEVFATGSVVDGAEAFRRR